MIYRGLLSGIAVCLMAMLVFCRPGPAAADPYRGPVFDAMGQLDETMDLGEVTGQLKLAGVAKFAVFARSRKHLGKNRKLLLDLRKKHPGLIVLGAPKYFKLHMDLDEDYIRETIEGIKRFKYKFVGEILYTHGDKKNGKVTADGERYVDPSAPGTARLLVLLKPLKVPVMTHWEAYAWERDRPKFRKLYSGHPDQVFIIPHMAFLTPDQAGEILSGHPNVYMTISKKFRGVEFYADPEKAGHTGKGMLDENKRIKPAWRKFLIRHSKRLMFGTDVIRAWKWERYAGKIKAWRRLAGRLPTETAEDISYRTAERVYGVKAAQ